MRSWLDLISLCVAALALGVSLANAFTLADHLHDHAAHEALTWEASR
jgi:hypothetical protein